MFADLQGKRVLVTGASSGLGAHFAGVLAGHGAHVVAAARRLDRLAALATACEGLPGTVMPLALDVGSVAAIETGLAEASELLGGLDVLVNNAGIAEPGRALDVSEAQWDAHLDVNLKGCFFAAQAAARIMAGQESGGAIINIASILGERVAASVAPYAVSKAGLIQMTKALALEWARHKVRVNALAPGYIVTDLNRDFFASDDGKSLLRRIPMRRAGELDDLDGPFLLLCSEASRYMSGAVIAVDGGHLVSGL
ncbi:SDR family NAD(P)-dependent oxidoreductase [Bosea caraganae]|uniref:SDR family NAD(P)-dependent oxidoreductase n=1 Tax=Bosea caraganae TaxID=2763117 RepID=A0A370LBI1_9HYPH|nr:SDR family oxidoreductase [Bosea caraganae]RDJ27183.1 SDR family NAD(P)-dependent oxidoreductase [Bosea caraganae]RDJ29200.1 SDR family NAD(P)-dependent oxidoreductase [Bosea caraganae]